MSGRPKGERVLRTVEVEQRPTCGYWMHMAEKSTVRR
jgi:hypothetical protein